MVACQGACLLGGMPAAPTRRERKRKNVGDRLYEAALALFVDKGFDATTMDEIAERADVARATVFNHYPQKAAFLEEWGRRRRARVAEILVGEHVQDLPGPEQLRHYLREMAELNTGARRETAALMDASLRFGSPLRGPALEVELTDVIRRGQDRGELCPDADPALAGQVLAAGYFATVLRWAGDEHPFDLTRRLEDLANLVLGGLLPRGTI
jgi:AcrR family transcriptional regulator